MPRGRKKRLVNRNLPQFSKIPLFVHAAVRQQVISRSAAWLWSVIRLIAWQDMVKGQFSPPPVDLTDEELQAWMGGLTRQRIHQLLDELQAANMLALSHDQGRRWLQLLVPGVGGNYGQICFTSNELHDDEDHLASAGDVGHLHPHPDLSQEAGRARQIDFTSNTFDVKSNLRQTDFTSNIFDVKSNLRQTDFASNRFDTNSGSAQSIAAVLIAHNVFPAPAGEIAARMARAGKTADEALEIFLDVLNETGSMELTVSRLKMGYWDTTAPDQVLEKARARARRRYHESVAAEGGGVFPRAEQSVGTGPQPDESVHKLIGEKTAAQIWEAALGELQLQMTRATFDTWLRDSRLLGYEDGVFIVGVKNGYAQDLLEHRLHSTVVRTLVRLVGHPVDVQFTAPDSADLSRPEQAAP